jgi:hypothetical protein
MNRNTLSAVLGVGALTFLCPGCASDGKSGEKHSEREGKGEHSKREGRGEHR